MDLTLSGDFAKHLLSMTKKDKKLAEAMARQFLRSIESSSLAAYLLSADVATALLADRIMHNPEKTIQDLQRLPTSETPVDGRSNRRVGAPRKAAGRPAKKSGRRHRLTANELSRIKQQVGTFLARHPWSTRKQIAMAVSFPTVAAYNRIMNELKAEKVIMSQGEKSKTVYALYGASKKAKGSKRPAKAAAKKAKKAKKVRAKRAGRRPTSKRAKAAPAKRKRTQPKKAAAPAAAAPEATA